MPRVNANLDLDLDAAAINGLLLAIPVRCEILSHVTRKASSISHTDSLQTPHSQKMSRRKPSCESTLSGTDTSLPQSSPHISTAL